MDSARRPADMKLQRSGRDTGLFATRIAEWLMTVLPAGRTDPEVMLRDGIDTNGMSSETLVLEIVWTEGGERRTGRYVARVAPADDDVPVFREYALRDQYETMRLVGELTDVPVPQVRWIEPEGTVIGSPFFLMDHVEGLVPRDVLPYNFGDNWLFDATADQRHRLQELSVEAIAKLHAIPDAAETFGFLAPKEGADGDALLVRELARTRAWYDFAVAGLDRSPLVERGLTWLEAHLPEPSETVLCWGDARIGNILYHDFAPAGVLDWEMASIGPRELDLSWLVFAHRVFESITGMLELPGMPDFLREDDVRATYEKLSGTALGDLRWYHVYNAVRWAIVFMRTGTRQIHFGEIERPGDIESVMHHRPLLEQTLDEVGA
ncbi:phosphotransferase family protein [Actinomadura sp. DC4]|uniref:phosphotransferase family protein n=1 Tax=Actinomadura sp. DC4 TaxID=3055069 RepID=UPI0025B00C2A|nr:phosphotransferase family protein [Actinomadura sp. DC4]MDN3353689.1 phosphotransferase family protein [Actinomadura sp. DC4]